MRYEVIMTAIVTVELKVIVEADDDTGALDRAHESVNTDRLWPDCEAESVTVRLGEGYITDVRGDDE